MLYSSIPESVHAIGECIKESEHSFFVCRKKNQRMNFKLKNEVAFLKTGSLSILRNDNQLVTFSLNGPAIVGMAQLFHQECTHFFRCDSESEMFLLDQNVFCDLLTAKNLWFHAFNILNHHMEIYFQREKRLIQKNIKGIVVEHLIYIWNQGANFREKTSVYTFILARNQVSRSSLHKIMAQLTEEGLIKLDHGKLICFRYDALDH